MSFWAWRLSISCCRSDRQLPSSSSSSSSSSLSLGNSFPVAVVLALTSDQRTSAGNAEERFGHVPLVWKDDVSLRVYARERERERGRQAEEKDRKTGRMRLALQGCNYGLAFR